MTITTKGDFKVLNVRDWRKLYRVSMDGDIFYTDRTHEHWVPVISQTARRVIWETYAREGHRFPWRESNGENIHIQGFIRFFRPLGVDQLVGWFICIACGASYTDKPSTVDDIRKQGCDIPTCANHREFKVESVLKVCGACGEETYDTHGEIDVCPKCQTKL
jgi:hypothetical protein